MNKRKIVQSFWSKPFLKSGPSIKEDRKYGGFRSKRFFYFSWALSCFQIKKYYDHLELITDDFGQNLLINKLDLPYDSVSLELNTLKYSNPDFWALGKLKAYELQTEPFIHIDGDVFLWEPLPEKLERNELVSQNIDNDISPELLKTIEDFYSSSLYRPTCMDDISEIKMYNAGILGGNDIDFFQKYVREAYNLISKNTRYLNRINSGNFNMIFEQLLFYCMVEDSKKNVKCLLKNVDKNYTGLANFRESPYHRKFLHLVGKYKLYEDICRQLEVRLLVLYPKTYYKIIQLIETNEL